MSKMWVELALEEMQRLHSDRLVYPSGTVVTREQCLEVLNNPPTTVTHLRCSAC